MKWRKFCLTMALCCVFAPILANAAPSPSPTPTPEPVAELSAQHAEAQRSRMYETGLVYGSWLDGLARETGSEFLQTRLFDRVTWMRLLACVVSLAIIALLTGSFLWYVRRRAGEIESNQRQSWWALAAAAIRKPLALIIWVLGG
ncbi:MAG: hypothetical protein ACREFG_00110, partial [Chthoniobacterales bacterium]